MVRAIMHGCNGHMGQVITGLIKADKEGIELVAGIDKYTGIANDYPVFESLEKCDVEADVIIDFSNAAAARLLCLHTAKRKKCRLFSARPVFPRNNLQRFQRQQRKQLF